MRALAILLLLAGIWLLPPAVARAEEETPSSLAPAEQSAIRGVIEAQLGAFQGDDAKTAFGYASPGIQGMFGDAATFLQMVRQGYPPVYRARSHAFGPLVELQGRTVQKVELVGPDGQRALALYVMEHEPDGSWRIDGCMLTQSDSVGA